MWKDLVNQDLYNYVTNDIFKMYELNGKSHNKDHVNDVLNRALEISEKYNDLNKDMLFTAVAFHDVGDHIDRKNHEIISAQIMMEDKYLNNFFNSEQKEIIKQAIEDHRSSKGKIPKSIYGKILASADKNIDVNGYFYKACEYQLEHYKENTEDQQLDKVYEHAVEKFGKNGYAVDKYYVQDDKYTKYLQQLQDLIEDKERFYEIARKTYNEILSKK